MNIHAKRERKRLKRLCQIRGRITAFGFKSYPEEVLKAMKEAKAKRLEGRLP